MKISNVKILFSKLFSRRDLVIVGAILVVFGVFLSTQIQAHGGEDHSGETKTVAAATNAPQIASIVAAERNLQTDAGEFNVVLRRSPADPRTGENTRFLVRFAEKVEGGFGGGAPIALEKAAVAVSIAAANGAKIAENISSRAETGGNYRAEYAFQKPGDYKIIFNVTTADKRAFTVDFPVSAAAAPVRSSFWLGLTVLTVLTLGLLAVIVYKQKRIGAAKAEKFTPAAISAGAIFVFGVFALMYFLPMRETRAIAEIPLNAAASPIEEALETKISLTVPKESQLLFGIKTEPVATRQITGGLKTNGIVRARPDAKAVITPPVAGRLVLRRGIMIGAAVGRGEQIGYIEQILDVSGQTELESQRLEVEAQQREVEAQKLQIKNTVLQLQAQQAEQRAQAQQAKIRLAQAQRELRRSENLLEVGAVPKRRVEEAQTAVKVAEQEVASAEKQAALLENQIRQTNAGQAIFRNPRVNTPNKTFPLTAPVTGIINQINAASGQQVETATEILSLANLSTVLIEAQVFERDLPTVRESARASFTSAALSNEVYTIGTADGDGRLVSVGQIVNEQTRTFPVIYEVINPLQRLRDGMFVEITIDTSGNQNVLAVPKRAVVSEQGQTFVFVFDGGETFEKRPVAPGTEGADFYEIKSGLKEGERVVTEGIYQLRSTQPSA